MCGIIGVLNLNQAPPVSQAVLRQMLASIRHRGPDQFGIYMSNQIGMGSARLSIIDLSSGQQPISSDDDNLWIVFNGEIFNYPELRAGLLERGHTFKTTSDTEVLLHLYQEYGLDCLAQLNGQFGFAIWDNRQRKLFMARDRLGIRPIFYTVSDGKLIFGSEIKALLCYPGVEAQIDPFSMDQVFTYWSPQTPRTAFKDIWEIPPGHWLVAQDGKFDIQPYWQVRFPPPEQQSAWRQASFRTQLHDSVEQFRELLIDATKLRLRADVPVGAYLSGGIDSSTTAAIVRNFTGNHLDTFSIVFEEQAFDESAYQAKMAQYLGTEHQIVYASNQSIGAAFPDVIWHTETPLLRTAPTPLFLLSQLVHENNYKVVLTGEGADEFLAGYNIFREAMTRRFWSRQPDSALRPLLLKRLYPYLDLSSSGGAYLKKFFGQGLAAIDDPSFSHHIRWNNTRRTKRFFSPELRHIIDSQGKNHLAIAYPDAFNDWTPLQQAQYLEITTFLSPYLLSSQGDRMAMAHSVEGRFPFLDHRVVEFCNTMPPYLKLFGLNEKFLLKKVAQDWLPEEIWSRSKQPYRAPIHKTFFGPSQPNYIPELLSEGSLKAAGLFDSNAVGQLVRKLSAGKDVGETDDMALAGIISSQLLYQQFVAEFRTPLPLDGGQDVKICIQSQ